MSFSFKQSFGAVAAVAGLSAILASGSVLANGHKGNSQRTYEVRITNITRKNQFTPILAAVHTRNASLFTLGDAPSEGLAILAEGGDTAALQNVLSENNQVSFADTFIFSDGAPLTMAGSTIEFTVSTPRRFRYLSLAAMILPTNDSFVALNTVPLPNRGSRTYTALGYDAGSEDNDELCVSIPGPTCGGDGSFSGFNGEGFVHISSGIHGKGDLAPGDYDWRNPIARVEIRRIR